MRKGGLFWRHFWAMALLAVALLNLATVRSNVMQAASFMPGGMAGASMVERCSVRTAPKQSVRAGVRPARAHASCPYCDSASNPPLCGAEVQAPRPSTIAWADYEVLGFLGARGPPSFTPRARGPPLLS